MKCSTLLRGTLLLLAIGWNAWYFWPHNELNVPMPMKHKRLNVNDVKLSRLVPRVKSTSFTESSAKRHSKTPSKDETSRTMHSNHGDANEPFLLILGMYTRYGNYDRVVPFMKTLKRAMKHDRWRLILLDTHPETPLSSKQFNRLHEEHTNVRVVTLGMLKSDEYAGLLDTPRYSRFRDDLLRVRGQDDAFVHNMTLPKTGAELLFAWNRVAHMQRRQLHFFLVLLHQLQYGPIPSVVLLTDIIDVVLQDDPLNAFQRTFPNSQWQVPLSINPSMNELLSSPKLLIFGEEGCHGHTGSNWWWLKSCFGEQYTQWYHNKTAPICGGTAFATTSAMYWHLQFTLKMIGRRTGQANLCLADQPLISMFVRQMYQKHKACMSVDGERYCMHEWCSLFNDDSDSDTLVVMDDVSVQLPDVGDGDVATLACYHPDRKTQGFAHFNYTEVFELVDETTSDGAAKWIRFRKSGHFPAIVHQYPRIDAVRKHVLHRVQMLKD